MNARLFDELAGRCAADAQFRLAARHWNGAFRFEAPDEVATVVVRDGQVDFSAEPVDLIVLTAEADVWARLLEAKPPRLFNDLSHLLKHGHVTLAADPVRYAQYYAAIARAVELLRPPLAETTPTLPESTREDSPIGRYVPVDVAGIRYRIYYEEAGQGIPLLLQHTAGAHGAQWRHLFEDEQIKQQFRLIAYDLPFHGKSLPPSGVRWWEEEYRLTSAFLLEFIPAFSAALKLDRPVFMGCSVGGVLALELAGRRPDDVRAVVSLEGVLKVDADYARQSMLWHPQVSTEYRGRLMNGMMSPTSPEAFRKETSMVYAAGWPPVFLGDLFYYMQDYDMRAAAAEIDTLRVQVHIMSGEYDASGTAELGQEAHRAIAGSTWTYMEDVGHFPMSENPVAFLHYLRPILQQISGTTDSEASTTADAMEDI